eukprot:jgi/Chrpa1/13778/Chrysochromulina_OHIO_Genome00019316-RA
MAPKPKPVGITIGPNKTQMLALGEAVADRMRREQQAEGTYIPTQDPEKPPPAAIRLEGATLGGMCAGFLGYYERCMAREVSGGAPCYRHSANPVLYLARDPEGHWRGQLQGKLGELSSLLKLVDRDCVYPTSKSDAPWQWVDPDTRDWQEAWTLKVREAEIAEIEAERAQRKPVPTVIALEAGAASVPIVGGSGLTPGYEGLYRRGKQRNEKGLEEDAVHNGSACWRHVSNPMLWIARGPDGGWMGVDDLLWEAKGSPGGVLRLRDAVCAHPTDASAGWFAHDGARWVERPGLRCRRADETEAAAEEAALPAAPRLISVELAGGASGGASGGPAAEYTGVYERQEGHVNRSAAWRRVRGGPEGDAIDEKRSEASCWLVRGRNGCWVGQRGAVLGKESGQLQLPYTALLLPTAAAPTQIWQEWHEGKWHGVPGLRCVVVEQGDATDGKVVVGLADPS